MSLIPSGQIASLEATMDQLWDTFKKPINIVKKATAVAVDASAGFVPGYGIVSNDSNYELTTESMEFYCLRVAKNLGGKMDPLSEKAISEEDIIIKVEQEARDYIMNGVANEYAVYKGKTYNIISLDQPNFFLGKTYYYFKLSLTS